MINRPIGGRRPTQRGPPRASAEGGWTCIAAVVVAAVANVVLYVQGLDLGVGRYLDVEIYEISEIYVGADGIYEIYEIQWMDGGMVDWMVGGWMVVQWIDG